MNTDRDEIVRVRIERGREEADNFVTHVVREAALVGLFVGGHKLVHGTGEFIHDSTLNLRLAFDCVKSATYGYRRGVTGVRTTT